MKRDWKKLYIRKDCDLPTFAAAIDCAYGILRRHAKSRREYLFAYFKNRNIHYYIHDIDEFEPGRALYKKSYLDPLKMKEIFRQGKTFIANTEQKTKKWKHTLAEPSKPHLLSAIFDFKREFQIINDEYSIRPWWALESWQKDFLAILDTLIKKNGLLNQRDSIIRSALTPLRKTAIEEIQEQYAAGVSIASLADSFQFLRSWTVVWSKPITDEWIVGVCKKITKGQSAVITAARLVRLLRPNAVEERYLRSAPYVVFFKDWRDDLRRKHAFLWNFLFVAIGDYLGVSADDLGYFTLAEIENMVRVGSIKNDTLQSRKVNGCVLTTARGKDAIKVIEFGDSAFATYLTRIKTAEDAERKHTLTGIVGQPGTARGRVVVVRHYKDVFRVRDGDILVANTTHPNYLLGMKKAGAFVTDEGGIACHAAIVAREMKKPCIVGTKVATKMLKEGDMIEVDAEKGIVLKIGPGVG